MHLPQPKLPAKKKVAVPLPTPRVPAAAKPNVGAVMPPRAPSATSSLRGSVLSSLMQGPTTVPAPRVGGGSSDNLRAAVDVAVDVGDDACAFAGPSLRSARPVSRPRPTFEVVARFPGALEVEVATQKQGEAATLVVSKVRDLAAQGGFGDDGALSVVGLAVVGVSAVPHRIAPPPPPGTLLELRARLGTGAPPADFPLYVHLAEPRADADVAAASAFGAAAAAELPRVEGLALDDAPARTWHLRQVIVATNRRPAFEDGEARFAPTLDTAAVDDRAGELLSTYQLRASAGADKLDDADEDGLFWGAATVAYDAALPDAGAPACTDKAHWEYVGWAPLARGAALAKLRAASDDAFARGEDGAILAYVHGFNTGLQFAARSGALYGAAMARPVVLVFAWPSNPPLPRSWAISAVLSVAERNYTAAEQSMQRSVVALAVLARALRKLVGAAGGDARVQWKAHSMGCYLLLNALNATRDPDARAFHRVVLDAPDVPTWFFEDTVRSAIKHDVRFFHCFHARDEAVEISRQRRGLDFPVPGNGAVLVNEPGFTCLDCSAAYCSLGNHDYGRVDHTAVAEQANFLAGGRADDRPNCDPGPGVGVWVLRKWAPEHVVN